MKNLFEQNQPGWDAFIKHYRFGESRIEDAILVQTLLWLGRTAFRRLAANYQVRFAEMHALLKDQGFDGTRDDIPPALLHLGKEA